MPSIDLASSRSAEPLLRWNRSARVAGHRIRAGKRFGLSMVIALLVPGGVATPVAVEAQARAERPRPTYAEKEGRFEAPEACKEAQELSTTRPHTEEARQKTSECDAITRWLYTLPSVSDVEAYFPGEPAARNATLQPLRDYVNMEVGWDLGRATRDAPPQAVERWKAHEAAQSPLSEEAKRLYEDSDFRTQTLWALVSTSAGDPAGSSCRCRKTWRSAQPSSRVPARRCRPRSCGHLRPGSSRRSSARLRAPGVRIAQRAAPRGLRAPRNRHAGGAMLDRSVQKSENAATHPAAPKGGIPVRHPARRPVPWLPLIAALLGPWPAQAASAVTFEWVVVGDPGNPCDDEPSFGCYGAVDYVFRIATHEVTNAQYAEFLNAKAASDPLELYNPGMGSGNGGIARSGSDGSYTYSAIPGREARPVTRVSFFDALRFANWLHNGQDDGDTETGAYTLLGGTPTPSNLLVQRNPEATIWLATDEEWYKAAHYDTVSGSYSEYPTGTDAEVVCTPPTATPNTANCDGFDGPGPGDLTDVGSYPGSPSPNGTFDQCGNALEWTDGDVGVLENRTMRGGSYLHRPDRLGREIRDYDDPWVEKAWVGFRVATVAAECADGIDNDGDGRIDFDPVTFASPGDETTPPAGSGDPACASADFHTESAQCQDGIDNDGDGAVDYDAGLSANGVADPGGADPQCAQPWRNNELRLRVACGLGAELALLLPPLVWLRRRSRPGRERLLRP